MSFECLSPVGGMPFGVSGLGGDMSWGAHFALHFPDILWGPHLGGGVGAQGGRARQGLRGRGGGGGDVQPGQPLALHARWPLA